MKNTIKRIAAFVLTAAIVICCASCGLDMSKVKGDWTLETAGGKTVDELAAANGCDPAYVAMNATVTDDTFTLTSSAGSFSYSIKVKANGFECYDANKNLAVGVIYDSAKDTLSFQATDAAGNLVEHVMKKGTAVISTSPNGEEAAEENAEENAGDEGEYAENEGEYAEDEGEYAEDEGEYAEDEGEYAEE